MEASAVFLYLFIAVGICSGFQPCPPTWKLPPASSMPESHLCAQKTNLAGLKSSVCYIYIYKTEMYVRVSRWREGGGGGGGGLPRETRRENFYHGMPGWT